MHVMRRIRIDREFRTGASFATYAASINLVRQNLGSLPPFRLVIEPQAKLNRPRLIALSIHVSETPRAEVRVWIAEVRPIKEVAELSFEPHFEPFLHCKDLENTHVLVESGESTN